MYTWQGIFPYFLQLSGDAIVWNLFFSSVKRMETKFGLEFGTGLTDFSSNSKRGGICVYYKSSLPFRLINLKDLQKSLLFEIRIGSKCCKFSCLYRSPSQTQDEFETFPKKFELSLDKIHENNLFMTVVLADFNAMSNDCTKLISLPLNALRLIL